MGTGTSRRLRLLGSVALATLGLAACGGSRPDGFAWLHARPVPPGWKIARVPNGAQLAYPASWARQRSDPGTATAALTSSGGRFLGYLNLTQRQGDETLANWSSFRLGHNTEEGDRSVHKLASATGLRFLTGHGSCVEDSYTTRTGSRYVEIACLVVGRRSASVIVAAAPPNRWNATSRVMKRAIEAVTT